MSEMISVTDVVLQAIKDDTQNIQTGFKTHRPEYPSEVIGRWHREAMELREMVGTTGKKPGKV